MFALLRMMKREPDRMAPHNLESGKSPMSVNLEPLTTETTEVSPKTNRPVSLWRRWRARWRAFSQRIPRPVKMLIATVVGTLLILVGIVLSLPMVPGPGTALILSGIAVLATEYIWAKHLLEKIKAAWLWFKAAWLRFKPRYVDPLISRYRRWRGLDKRK